MNRKELEEAGLIYPAQPQRMPLIIKYNGIFLNREDRDRIREELEQTAGCKTVLLPPGFDLVTAPGRWIARTDKAYAGGGYMECSVCGQRYSWGAYHEPQEFRHCPRCGHQMEVEEDE